jgi:hypothetical protein
MGLLAACLLTATATNVAAQTAAPVQSPDADRLRKQIADELKQLEAMQKTLALQQQQLDRATKSEPAATPTSAQAATPVLRRPLLAPLGDVASTSPMVPLGANADQMPADDDKSSPLQFKIGNASITPVGFMDFIGVFRSTATGNGLGTNFGGIPVNTPTTATAHLTEAQMSAQNSRVGFRVDTNYKGYQVLGYLETDFLGNAPAGLAVTSNGDTLRLRLFFADIKKDTWEIAGGQMWSMLTPSRNGIGVLPGDLFYSQNIDTNYQLGLTWSRDPGFRVVVHPNKHVSLGLSLEEAQQYMGGNNGGSKIVLPTALSGLAATQLSDGTPTGFTIPAVTPDVIVKAAFDGKFANGNGWHFELAGLYRDFKIYDTALTTPQSFTANGGAGQFNFNVELAKGFRLVANNFYGTGGGRYMMGQAPDLMVNANGTLSTIKSGSTLDGFEYTHKKTLIYAYYSAVYIDKQQALDANGKTVIGYGYTNTSGFGQNRAIQETTFGFNQTLWKDAKYGAVNYAMQYSYVNRAPWFAAAGQPSNAHVNMIYADFRYTLPGSAPTMGK